MKTIKQYLNTLVATLIRYREAWLLSRIIRRARIMHRNGGGQVFVVNVCGRATIISKAHFRDMRQHGQFPMSYTAADLRRIAIYTSPR